MNRFLSLLLLLACSFVAQAASPSYNTSTGVVSPTQFLKMDAAELKVMGVDVLTSAPNIYTTDGTLSGDRTLNGGGNDLTFTNVGFFNVSSSNMVVLAGEMTLLGVDPGYTAQSDDGAVSYYYSKQAHVEDGTGNFIDISAVGAPTIYVEKTGGDYLFFLNGAAGDSDTVLDIDTGGLTHTSGNLVEVKNNTTNVFTIDHLGNITANNINIPGDQTANNLTITNTLTVKGSIKADNLTITNNVTFYNNTYVSNFFATATTVSNNLTVLGDYIGTIDPTVTGTTIKLQKSLKLQFPRKIDGAGCTYSNTNDYTSLLFMLPTFSPTAATNVNNCDFAFRVPGDLDTSKDLTASLTIRLTDVDTAAHTYNVGMISIANSSSASGTPANYVPLTISADGSGGSGDIESVSAVTLTDWKSNMTAGQWCLLRLNRDGDDDSTVASNMMELEIFYWATQ